MTYTLAYTSSAARLMSEAEMSVLHERSRVANAALRVTGMLLHRDRRFFQVLEGEQRRVEDLYAKICFDGRHRRVALLMQGAVEKREFPQWSMGFEDLDGARSHGMESCIGDIQAAIAVNRSLQTPSRALQLLAQFAGFEQ